MCGNASSTSCVAAKTAVCGGERELRTAVAIIVQNMCVVFPTRHGVDANAKVLTLLTRLLYKGAAGL